MKKFVRLFIILFTCLYAYSAQAQQKTDPNKPEPPKKEEKDPLSGFKPFALVETYYGWNFNNPPNGLDSERMGDSARHNNFTLSNAALGAFWNRDQFSAKFVLMIPQSNAAAYPATPSSSGDPALADAASWKYIQEAWLSYKAPLGEGLTISAGLFRGPFSIEKTFVKDNLNWSHGLNFYAMRIYSVGVRLKQQLDQNWSVTVGGFNGWNNIVDNNEGKSILGQLSYELPDQFSWTLLYSGGPERAKDAAEGDDSWRNYFETYLKWRPHPRIQLMAQLDGGFEQNKIGTSSWYGGAVFGQWQVWRPTPSTGFFLTGRTELYFENVPEKGDTKAAPIFWGGSKYISSATVGADLRPIDKLSFQLELRRDQAQAPLFYESGATKDEKGGYVPTARNQTTLVAGATAWF